MTTGSKVIDIPQEESATRSKYTYVITYDEQAYRVKADGWGHAKVLIQKYVESTRVDK